jgi:hypothetical protein
MHRPKDELQGPFATPQKPTAMSWEEIICRPGTRKGIRWLFGTCRGIAWAKLHAPHWDSEGGPVEAISWILLIFASTTSNRLSEIFAASMCKVKAIGTPRMG